MDMKTFCKRQVEEALRYKWIQSQKVGRDLGDAAIHEWVKKFAAQFRKDYNQTYISMVEAVAIATIKELSKNNIQVDEKLVQIIVKISIDKFTEKWTVDMCKEDNGIADCI